MSSKGKRRTPKGLRHKGKKPLVPKWKLFRSNEPLLSVFMWGINHSVNELSHVPPPGLLMPDDFKAYFKIKVDNHGFNKDNMPSHFKVKEYCPNVFRNLRERFGIMEHEYLKSLADSELSRWPTNRFLLSYNRKFCVKITNAETVAEVLNILSKYYERSLSHYEPEVGEGSGRSGARFYLSSDKKFLIKTLCPEEIAEVHSILRGYHEFVVEKHGKTLLPQYLGMYRLTVEGSETYLIVMRNIFGRKYPVHKKYDLKGSTVQRQASEKERSKDLPTFKDNDFLDEKCKLFLPDDAKKKLLDMLTADIGFLSKLHLMDYSLLVGIHDCEKAAEECTAEDNEEEPNRIGGDSSDPQDPDTASQGSEEFQPTPPDSPIPSTGAFAPLPTDGALELDNEFYAIPSNPDAPKKEIYFIGLVDILTYYGVKKKTASAAKTVKYGSEAEISTVKPEQYGNRLVQFVARAIEGKSFSADENQ